MGTKQIGYDLGSIQHFSKLDMYLLLFFTSFYTFSPLHQPKPPLTRFLFLMEVTGNDMDVLMLLRNSTFTPAVFDFFYFIEVLKETIQ